MKMQLYKKIMFVSLKKKILKKRKAFSFIINAQLTKQKKKKNKENKHTNFSNKKRKTFFVLGFDSLFPYKVFIF